MTVLGVHLLPIEDAKLLFESWTVKGHKLGKHLSLSLERQFIVSIAVEKGPFLRGVAMQVEVVQQSFGLAVVTYQVLHAINGGLPVVAHQVVPVEVVATGVKSVEALLDAIRVQHGHNNNLKVFSQQLCLLFIPCEILEDALCSPAGGGLPWVHSAADEDDWFIEVALGSLQVLFGEKDRVGDLSDALLHLGALVRRGYRYGID